MVKEKLRKRKNTYNIFEYENIIDYNSISFYIDEREEIDMIERILQNLKEIDIKIINLFYYSSKSTKDIAKELNLSEVNVRKRLFRTRKKIRRILNAGGNNGK